MSKRKPCNDFGGYVTSRKSHHPQLPGYFWVCDRDKGGDWLIGGESNRWACVYEPGENYMFSPSLVTTETKIDAIIIMKSAAKGSNALDFGQND